MRKKLRNQASLGTPLRKWWESAAQQATRKQPQNFTLRQCFPGADASALLGTRQHDLRLHSSSTEPCPLPALTPSRGAWGKQAEASFKNATQPETASGQFRVCAVQVLSGQKTQSADIFSAEDSKSQAAPRSRMV